MSEDIEIYRIIGNNKDQSFLEKRSYSEPLIKSSCDTNPTEWGREVLDRLVEGIEKMGHANASIDSIRRNDEAIFCVGKYTPNKSR